LVLRRDLEALFDAHRECADDRLRGAKWFHPSVSATCSSTLTQSCVSTWVNHVVSICVRA
jgi:hypothetical protein